ncbi:hypothetical protein LTR53_002102 [Teratosphaeriaceae sp. CCFEE 6253]|nr:hypothetical protein LTR53_002102 [Teratosphaeriaceae sp. CCFEE 6253]
MHTTLLTTILLGLNTVVYSAALPKKHSTTDTHHGTATYCSAPGVCAPMDVSGQACHTFATAMPIITFSEGLTCTVYANVECTKSFVSKLGKVKGVQGTFDVGMDGRAGEKGLGGWVGSFFC